MTGAAIFCDAAHQTAFDEQSLVVVPLLTSEEAEALRLQSPEQTVRRRCAADTKLAAVPIPAGARIMLHLGAANRDPSIAARPAIFDLQAPQKRIGFGVGLHKCIGAGPVRSTARIALEKLIDRFCLIELVLPIGQLRYVRSSHFRGLEALPIRSSVAGLIKS